jgi:flagellar protein FlbT
VTAKGINPALTNIAKHSRRRRAKPVADTIVKRRRGVAPPSPGTAHRARRRRSHRFVEDIAMSLKVELKPGERVIIGDCVVTNTDQRTRLLIDGQAPILREKDILTPRLADSPAKRIYLAVQLMYTSRSPVVHHQVYFELVRDILGAAPSTWPHIEAINNHILTGELYKALKSAKKLIAYETELLDNAKRRTGLRSSSEAGRKSA